MGQACSILNVGRAFSGDVHKLADETWQADLNGRRLADYGTRDAAMERVEYVPRTAAN
jgi:hypothetical protein